MRLFIINLFNLWRPVFLDLPKLNKPVLCYYKDNNYMICELKQYHNRIIFEGYDVAVSMPEITHWKYLPKKL